MMTRKEDTHDPRIAFCADLAQATLAAARDRVVSSLKGLGPDARQSGDDSGLSDVWEEYKYQIQRSESVFYELYVEEIERMAHEIVSQWSFGWRVILWLFAVPDSIGFDIEGGRLDQVDVEGALAEEIVSMVQTLASVEPLVFDPDE